MLFESFTEAKQLASSRRDIKQKDQAEARSFCFCAPGRIRTFVVRRRLIYSQMQLTTLPPTQHVHKSTFL